MPDEPDNPVPGTEPIPSPPSPAQPTEPPTEAPTPGGDVGIPSPSAPQPGQADG